MSLVTILDVTATGRVVRPPAGIGLMYYVGFGFGMHEFSNARMSACLST